ncbi:hypothetical protein TNCV_3831411 [Trichonephila clavipes]|nr:hypothetical protein TNCV_3831411 [Trichonephila clavipes]
MEKRGEEMEEIKTKLSMPYQKRKRKAKKSFGESLDFLRRKGAGGGVRVTRNDQRLKLPPSGMTVAIVQSVNGLCNARFTVWVSEANDLREYHYLMLAIGLHILSGQESTETGV